MTSGYCRNLEYLDLCGICDCVEQVKGNSPYFCDCRESKFFSVLAVCKYLLQIKKALWGKYRFTLIFGVTY